MKPQQRRVDVAGQDQLDPVQSPAQRGQPREGLVVQIVELGPAGGQRLRIPRAKSRQHAGPSVVGTTATESDHHTAGARRHSRLDELSYSVGTGETGVALAWGKQV